MTDPSVGEFTRTQRGREALLVVLAVLVPLFALGWGLFLCGRGETRFGLGMIAFSAVQLAVVLFLAG